MHILHAHYSPDDPGLFFWAESPDVAAPTPSRGRAAQNPKPKAHPFCGVPAISGEKRAVTLRLPAVRGIPLPSPQLVHNREIDTENPVLAPFLVDGIFLLPEVALTVLLAFSIPQPDSSGTYIFSTAFRYWSMAAALALETLTAQKLVPVLAGEDARWLPVLDSPKDAARMAQLTAAMPAVCRAETPGISPKTCSPVFSTPSATRSLAFGGKPLHQSFTEVMTPPPTAGWKPYSATTPPSNFSQPVARTRL